MACPLFVPLVEEGWVDHAATRLVAEEYLAPLLAREIGTLVLGCTHYPLLKPLLGRVAGPAVTLIDSAEETSLELKQLLVERDMLAPPNGGDQVFHRFAVSDDHELQICQPRAYANVIRVASFSRV